MLVYLGFWTLLTLIIGVSYFSLAMFQYILYQKTKDIKLQKENIFEGIRGLTQESGPASAVRMQQFVARTQVILLVFWGV